MTQFVVDATVAVKWYLTEEHSDAAERLLVDDHRRMAPELILVECANVLVKRQRRGELSSGDVQASLATLGDLIELRESATLVSAALDIAVVHERSAYDSLYLALALREGCRLVTADRRLYNGLSPTFHDTMLWVADL